MKNKTREPKMKLLPPGGGRARAEIPNQSDIDKLLEEHNALELAIETLVELLGATVEHYDKKSGQMVLEVDGATRVKAAATLIAYKVGEPIKRQQIMTGKLPTGPVDRGALREDIDKMIAARVQSPHVTLAELVQAQRALAESEKDTPVNPMTESELVEEARRIHGMDVTAPAPRPASPEPSPSDLPLLPEGGSS